MQYVSLHYQIYYNIVTSQYSTPCWKKTIETMTEFVMVLLVIMGIVLVLMEPVMVRTCRLLLVLVKILKEHVPKHTTGNQFLMVNS